MAPFVYAVYKAIEWRWWVSGIRFGDVRFESKLTDVALIGLYWIVIGWSWLILIVLLLWFLRRLRDRLLVARAGGVGRGSVRGDRCRTPVLIGAHRALGYHRLRAGLRRGGADLSAA